MACFVGEAIVQKRQFRMRQNRHTPHLRWRFAAAFTALALALFTALLATGSPAGAAVGGSHDKPSARARVHRVPGLVHPRPVPQRAPGPQHLLGASKAVPGKGASQPSAHDPAVIRADMTAAAQARRTGKSVVVQSETTENTEVLAHPDGELELISNALPVRVRQSGRWIAISTTLRRNRNGSWSAPLTSAPVTFSGGGTGPLVTARDPASGRWVSVSWPYRLPRPVVSGSVAVYKNVLPGVDLHLQATSTGYQEVLVVHNAAAAADPRLRSLTFTLSGGPGVRVERSLNGATVAVNSATGKVLFTSGQPMLWDSSHSRRLPAPSAESAGSGLVSTIPVSAAGLGRSREALTLRPPTIALHGRKFVYPVYVDPEISDSSTQYYAEVANFGGYWTTTTGTTSVGSGVVEEGDCGYSDCIYDWDGVQYDGYVDRDYFRMGTSALEERGGFYPDVYSATFFADEVGNSDGCTAQDVALYSAGAISSSTRWGGPEGSSYSEASSNAGGNSSCSEKDADVDLSATSYVKADEDDSDSSITFEIRAPSETNELQYKVFTDNPSLDVYYNFAPLEPTGLAVSDAVTCTSTTYTPDTEPTLSATGKDNNPSALDLDFTFTLDTSSGTKVASDTLDGYASGATAKWDSEGTLTSGDKYEFDVYTTNVLTSGDKSSARNSPTSAMYDFTDLSSPPSSAPTISSFDYPSGQWGQATGEPGVFTVGTNGDSNIAGFAYSFDGGSGSEPVPDTADCSYLSDGGLGTSANSSGGGNSTGELALGHGSSVQIEVPSGLAAGRHTLYVRSFDDAHNASPEAAYIFYVAPDYQSTSQPVTYTDASSLAASATGTNASLVTTQADSCCSITTWRGGDQLLFSATAAADTFTIPLSVPEAGTWQLGADMTTGPAYGEADVYLDQSSSDIALGGTANTPFDGYNPVVSNSYLDLGTQYLTAGSHTLTFTATGEDASSTGFQIGINYLTLSPTNRYEADSLTWSGTNSAGTLAPQCFSQAAWSDNCQLFLQNTAPGTSFTVSFDAPVESDYALGVNLGTADDYGELRFDLDPATSDINLDDTAAEPIDAYSSSVSARYVFLGGVHLTAGTHVLKVTVVGTDSSSVNNRYNAGINFLEVAPVTGATDASFTSAMNNLGIVSDNATSDTGYDFDLTGAATGNNLSLQALEAAGITPGTSGGTGTTFTANGATFTMQELKVSSSAVVADNVIPDGQTLPLPAVNATGVALLVLSTCGATPAAEATLNYSGAQSSNAVIPSVPDWIDGAPSGTVMLLSHRDLGSTPDTTAGHTVKVYEVMLPANPNAELSSITLPVMDANFLPGAGCSVSNVLHILAIGTRTVAGGPDGTVWTGAYEAPMDTGTTSAGATESNETLREVVPISDDGSGYVRLHLSNAHTNTPVTFDEATIAAQAAAGGAATTAPPEELQFGTSDSDSVTIPAGGDVWSNPVAMPSMSGGTGDLTVSLHIPSSDSVTAGSIHDSANLVTYYASGNDTTDQAGTDFSSTDSLTGLYYLSGVDVSQSTPTDGTIAVLGDQTATQAPAWTYGNWTSDLPAALSEAGVAVPGSIVDASTDDGQPSDWWRMNGTGLDTATTAYDSGSVGTNNLTLDGGAGWSTDNPGTGTTQGSLSLNGSTAYAQSAAPAVTTTGSFAVSAWVKLTSLPTHNAAVVAQDGTTDSAFYLDYEAATGDWSFKFPVSDTDSPTFEVASGPAAVAGVWTHLVGIYNASTSTATLFVNGVSAATVSITPIASTGDVTVGASLYNGGRTDFFPGEVSDVRAYNDRTMWGYNASEIYNDLGTSSITTSNAEATFEDYAAVEPNLRDVIVSLGANDVLEGQQASTIESNLTQLISDIEARYVSDEGNTAVQAFVTTIPPLGLASGDPREGVREAVNTWLLNNGTTALAVLDIAGAVEASTSSPNVINPDYLTNGVPNSSYYQAIANAVATDIVDAIPPVSF
jgi:Concanavalin A-like lectin/glucanases superfamily/OSK domain